MKVSIENLPRPISARAVNRRIIKQVNALWRDMGRAFVAAAFSKVRIDTGMSAASLVPLSLSVEMSSAFLASIQGRGPRPPKTNLPAMFAHQVGLPTSKMSGYLLGERAYETKYATEDDPEMLIKFTIVVYQYYMNEFGLEGPAWDSLNHGANAAMDFFTANWQSYLVPTLLGEAMYA